MVWQACPKPHNITQHNTAHTKEREREREREEEEEEGGGMRQVRIIMYAPS